jgi:hypothetical protein
MIVHKIDLPKKLNLFGKKPWEVPHIDTLELWKFGDYKHYTSLKLLTSILGVPSPKDDIDGSEVAAVYYKEKNLERIVRYCEKDTVAVAQILLRFNNEALIEDKIQKEKDKLIHHWEDEGIKVEKARWGRFKVSKGKTKIELPKTTDAEALTLDEVKAMLEKKSPKKKKAATKKKTTTKKGTTKKKSTKSKKK